MTDMLAAGSAGMAETPEPTSAQAWLSYTFGSTQPAGTVLALVADGTVLVTFTASKAMASVVYSGAQLASGQAVEIYTGATAEGDSVGGLTTNGSVADAQQVGTATAQGA